MAPEDPDVSEASGPRGRDVVGLADDHRRDPHRAGVHDPVGDRERDEDASRARADDEHEADHEHEEGEGEDDLDDARHDLVGDAAVVPGDRADDRAEAQREDDREDPDLEVGAPGPQQPRELVSSELVGAERMLPREPGEDVVQVLVVGRVWGNDGREDRRERDHPRQAAARDQRRAATSAPEERRPCSRSSRSSTTSTVVLIEAGSAGRATPRAGRWRGSRARRSWRTATSRLARPESRGP